MASKLYFREKGLSKQAKKRIGILCLVFVGALLIFQIILNRGEAEKKIEMAKASLPLITIETYDTTMGELHGYVKEMDACYMRDAIIPLDEDRKMTLAIDTYGYNVESVSYEVRSLDTERKIADTQVTDWQKEGNQWTTDIQIENLVEQGEEYLFVMTLHGKSQNIYYYTRIMMPTEEYIDKCLTFAKDFHNTALSDRYEELSSYVETSADSDKDDLGSVGIDSSIGQIGWQGFEGTVIGDPVIQLTDINDTYVSLVYSFQMQEESGGHINYYNVEEYYKIRYTPLQIYLLDYHRTMEQILDSGAVSAKENVLSVGITAGTVEYLSNETGTIVSFVQSGELFEYNQNKQKFTKVFGFIDDLTDPRERYQQHNIRILNIDETGNMDFVVYGYMNRGAHEGECGIDLYHYDSTKQEAVEQVFISTTHSYQILNANFSDLLYKNASGDFYIMLGGTIAKVGLDNLSTEEMITGLKSGQYAVSTSGRYVAWITEDEMADQISLMDLESEKIRTIQAEAGTKIKPLAFMTEDFVYGIANESDISTDAAGSAVYPMWEVRIVDTLSEDFEVLKSYHKEGFYVTGVTKDSYTLYLDRVMRQDGTFVDAQDDTIKDSAGEQNKTVTVEKVASETKGAETRFVMATLSDDKTIRSVSDHQATLATINQTKSISVSTTQQEETYFVYVGNRVTMTTQDLNKAITAADADMGIVIDNRQRYIWKRGKSAYVNAFRDVEVGDSDRSANTSAGCISAMLERKNVSAEVHALLERGETPIAIIQSALKEDLVLDLTGCTLSEVLYYVSQGAPVYARTGDNEALLIIGYDASNIIVYHSDTDRYTKMTNDSATKLFESAGNVFISYVE